MENRLLGPGDVESVGEGAIDVLPVAFIGMLGDVAFDDLDHLEPVGLGELVVALVVGRDGHHGPGAVAPEDVVGDVDRDLPPVDGIHGVGAGENPRFLLFRGGYAGQIALGRRFFDIAFDRFFVIGMDDRPKERVLRGEAAIGAAEKGIDPGGEDLEMEVGESDPELDLDPGGAADPVLLHLEGRLRPVEALESFLELVGIGGYLEDPLPHRHPDDRVAAALAFPVDHLFVGEDGPEFRAIVDRDVGNVGEVVLEKLHENPLGPLVVFRVDRRDFPRPVVGKAEHLELLAEVVDVFPGEGFRMLVVLDGELLGR